MSTSLLLLLPGLSPATPSLQNSSSHVQVKVKVSHTVVSDSLQLYTTRLLCPWGFSRQKYWSESPYPPPGDLPNPGTEPMSPASPAMQADSLPTEPLGKPHASLMLLLLLSRFSRVRLCATPETAAHQAPPSLGFSWQEHWSGLPFPSPMRESEVAQSCPTLSDRMDCSPPGSSVHGIFQARVLEWTNSYNSQENKNLKNRGTELTFSQR